VFPSVKPWSSGDTIQSDSGCFPNQGHERAATSIPAHGHDRSSGSSGPVCVGLGRDGRRPGRLLVHPALAGDKRVQLWTDRRARRDVEDRLAALPADPGVGAVHGSEVSGLLRLVRNAAEAVSRGAAHRPWCPDSHLGRLVLERRHRSGAALARSASGLPSSAFASCA
jgi:hypothetical protein